MTQLFFTSPRNSKTQHLGSIFHSSTSNCIARRVQASDLASLSANRCTEPKSEAKADVRNKRRPWSHGYCCGPRVWTLAPSLGSLKQPTSLARAQPAGFACSRHFNPRAELPKRLSYTKKSSWATHPVQPTDSQHRPTPLEVIQPNLSLNSRLCPPIFRVSPKGWRWDNLSGNLCQHLTPLTV